jgi:transposase
MESTGVYGLDLALALAAQAGIQVRVANPRAARHDPHLRAFYTSAHK